MDGDQLKVHGPGGIELQVPIAGPGSRSYAFIIDWHIRLLVALAWLLIATLVENGRLVWAAQGGKLTAATAFFIFLPAALVYFLYHPVLEILMRGQTPGKRIAGVRVVSQEGGVPSVGALLTRNVFRLIDSLPGLYFLGLVTTIVTAQRVRVGDLAAGTLLITDQQTGSRHLERIAKAATHSNHDLASIDLIEQILERWPTLSIENRGRIARGLLLKIGTLDAASINAMPDEELERQLVQLNSGASVT